MLTDLKTQLQSITCNEVTIEQVYGNRLRHQRTPILRPKGERYYCPICNKWFRRFNKFGLQGRPNAQCPGCGSLERHRCIWLHLNRRIGSWRAKRKILHVAPELCIQQAILNLPGIKYIAIDLYDNDGNALKADLTNLPYSSAHFDFLICNHVLEHIQDDKKALGEIKRVLKPRGTALITVPIDLQKCQTFEDETIDTPKKRNELFGHPYHVRICGRDYGKRIAQSGFQVKETLSTEFSSHKRRIHRINSVIIYDCRKI